MATNVYIQNSFVTGEITDNLLGRTDLENYYKSAKKIENFIVKPYGGIASRAGFGFVSTIDCDAGTTPRLFDFIYSQTLSYIVVMYVKDEDGCIDVYDNDGNLEASVSTDSGYDNETIWKLKKIQNGKIAYFADNNIKTSSPLNNYVKKLSYDGSTWTWANVTFVSDGLSVLLPDARVTLTKQPTATHPDNNAYYYYKVCGYNTKTGKQSLPTGVKTVSDACTTLDFTNYIEITITFTNDTERNNFLAVYDSFIIYKNQNGIFYKMYWVKTNTTTNSNTINDFGLSLNQADVPPEDFTDFSDSLGYPTALGFIQNRSWWGNIPSNAQKMWLSNLGQYEVLDYSYPIVDTRGIQVTLADIEKNDLEYLIESGKTLLLTSGGAYKFGASSDGNITPTNLSLKKQYNYGCSKLRPLVIGNRIVYITTSLKEVRDMAYEYTTDSFNGNELSFYVPELISESVIIDLCYQHYPNKCIWFIREDGMMLGLTYSVDNKVTAWHRHTTNGLFKSCATVKDNYKDILYVIVERNGNMVLERLLPDIFESNSVFDCFYLDSAVAYDGNKTSTITLSALTGNDITVTSTDNDFSSGDVGKAIFIRPVGYAEITSYVDQKEVVVNIISDFDSLTYSDWYLTSDTVSGLDHLVGYTVDIYADGNYLGRQLLENNSLTLGSQYGFILVGLQYISELQTTDLNIPNSPILFKNKLVNSIQAKTTKSRQFKVGVYENNLTYIYYDVAPDYLKELDVIQKLNISSRWNQPANISIIRDAPVPLNINCLEYGFSIGG